MELKPGYKQTEVGVIPEDWEVRRLDDLGSWRGGATPSMQIPVYWTNGAVLWASSGDIKSTLLSDTLLKITDTAVKQSMTALIPPNSILVVTRSGILRRYLPVSKNTKPLAINQDIKALIPNRSVNSDYLLHVLVSNGPRILATCLKLGTTVESVEYSWLKAHKIPLPAFPEQRAIAAALSDVDTLLAKLNALIAKKRDLKQAAMQQLLTGKQRLPGFSGEWEAQTIEQLEKARLIVLARGKVISKKDIERVPGDFPVYSSSVTSDGVFGRYGRFMFNEELITWSVDGGGHFFYRPRHRFSVTNVCGFMRVDPSKLSYRFLAAQLQLLHSRMTFDYLIKAHPSVIRKAYEVLVPILDEQRAIAAVFSDMDAEIEALEARREKTRTLKQGMMQELLTGRIRLL